MTNNVFANGREVACKAADGKSVAAFPDVAFTPPQTPATPLGVPIPYPNTGFAKDTAKGSRKVKISGKEVVLKNKSFFKKSTGDEAGRAPKKGIITGTITGKVYFNSWSMNVKVEGKNVVRHLDLTTHNHASMPGNTPVWPYMDSMSMDDYRTKCEKDVTKEMTACSDYTPYGEKDPCAELPPQGNMRNFADAAAYADHVAAHDCLSARRCQLVPKEPTDKQPGCCPGQTGHHLVEAASFVGVKGITKYEYSKAPCVCVEGYNQSFGTHGIMHTFQSTSAPATPTRSYAEARDNGTKAMKKTFPESGCNEECIKAQIDAYHKKHKEIDDDTQINTIKTGRRRPMSEEEATKAVDFRSSQVRRIKSNNLLSDRTHPYTVR